MIPDESAAKVPNLIRSILVSLILVPAMQPVCAAPALEQVLNEPYFDASDIEAVREGGFGVAKVHEASDREIAVVIACRVKVAPEQALAPFLGDSLPVDPKILRDQRLIDTNLHETSFAAISLARERDEIQHYLDARPGIGLNLSTDEIAAFRALKGENDPARVEALLEDMLRARFASYREQGLAGAQPYARDKGDQVSPGEELRKTEENMQGLHELYPEFHSAWLSYPRSLPKDIVGDDFFWLKLDIEDRPVFVLSHRLVAESEDMHLVGIRDYYVSHFFDVSQRAAVVTPLASGGHVLIYVERAWVDYWSGFASLSKKIGRKVMEKQMEHLLEDHGICGG